MGKFRGHLSACDERPRASADRVGLAGDRVPIVEAHRGGDRAVPGLRELEAAVLGVVDRRPA